jgi:hypothetical protein
MTIVGLQEANTMSEEEFSLAHLEKHFAACLQNEEIRKGTPLYILTTQKAVQSVKVYFF